MSKVWLILDANYLCYRAYHTTGTLSHNDIMTGVIYGYLRACADLVDEFRACSVIHCFDHGINKRLAILPGYKQSRRDRFAKMAPEEKKLKAELERQITLLKTQYLTELGYKNVFYADGFESDDIMAKVAACHMNMPPNRGIIVTGDADLYQVVRGRVRMHDPRKQLTYTERGLLNELGFHPRHYWRVLALAGCSTDEVPGLKGVGKATAIKFYLGQLPDGKVRQNIRANGQAVVKRNEPLVRLPFKDTPSFKLSLDDVTKEKWERLVDSMGMTSLRKHAPISIRNQ